jgi:hypothetical protein
MEGASRTRLVALAVLLAVFVPLVVIAVAGGGSDGGEPGGLRIEPSPQGEPDVVIYLEDPEVNEPETNHGRRSVTVECMDGDGAVVFSGRERWPFSDTDGGRFDPHVHVFMETAQVEQIARCRLKGTEPALEGRKA